LPRGETELDDAELESAAGGTYLSYTTTSRISINQTIQRQATTTDFGTIVQQGQESGAVSMDPAQVAISPTTLLAAQLSPTVTDPSTTSTTTTPVTTTTTDPTSPSGG
jgi:hypothetical protein